MYLNTYYIIVAKSFIMETNNDFDVYRLCSLNKMYKNKLKPKHENRAIIYIFIW